MKNLEITEMYNKIQKHGENLNKIFNTGKDPVKLCKQLRRYERKAQALNIDECNTGANHQREKEIILTAVKRILFKDTFAANSLLYKAVFLNGDPRGYSLKISDIYVREYNLEIHRDLGGYGIICPDYSPE